MSATFHNRTGGNKRLWDQCPTASLIWTASRILCDVHWVWDSEKRLYKTHQWDRQAFYKDVREWPAPNALSSLLCALREDERLNDPIMRMLGLYVALEYVTSLWAERR